MTLSQLALEDVETLCLGSSFLMADPMGPLLDQDEEALSPSSFLEVKGSASLSLPLSSSASAHSPSQTMSFSPFAPPSPPPSPPNHSSFLGIKSEANLLPFPLLGDNLLLETQDGSGDERDDTFEDMDWMSEKVDLSEFDLESLIDSCSSASPTSPEDLLASLESSVDLDLDSFDVNPECSGNKVLAMPSVSPHPQAAEVKSEGAPVQEIAVKFEESLSPVPPPAASPSYTLELGSEVDVMDADKTAPSLTATIIPDPRGVIQTTSPIVLSIPASGHLVVVLTNKEEPSPVPVLNLPGEPSSSHDCDSDSGIDSVTDSPAHHPISPSPVPGSSRTKPYSKPQSSASPKTPKVKSVSNPPKVVEKKLKKMEQNKTAATRYRQKKRVEQELLNEELEDLEKRNHELNEKAESICREIQYLKDLMEEVRKHRRGKTGSVE